MFDWSFDRSNGNVVILLGPQLWLHTKHWKRTQNIVTRLGCFTTAMTLYRIWSQHPLSGHRLRRLRIHGNRCAMQPVHTRGAIVLGGIAVSLRHNHTRHGAEQNGAYDDGWLGGLRRRCVATVLSIIFLNIFDRMSQNMLHATTACWLLSTLIMTQRSQYHKQTSECNANNRVFFVTPSTRITRCWAERIPWLWMIGRSMSKKVQPN